MLGAQKLEVRHVLGTCGLVGKLISISEPVTAIDYTVMEDASKLAGRTHNTLCIVVMARAYAEPALQLITVHLRIWSLDLHFGSSLGLNSGSS